MIFFGIISNVIMAISFSVIYGIRCPCPCNSKYFFHTVQLPRTCFLSSNREYVYSAEESLNTSLI